MPKNYGEIAFAESVKREQEKHGSRRHYERFGRVARGTELTTAESEFITERDSFYLATVSETGHPYVQFRGGKKGFLKVLDANTLAFEDFRGNMQYISTGNLEKNDRAALILMSYPTRQRLKIFARIEIVEKGTNDELFDKIDDPDYPAIIERAMILHVEAFDWNCPQHITPRYTLEEIREINQPLYEYIERLEEELRQLRATT